MFVKSDYLISNSTNLVIVTGGNDNADEEIKVEPEDDEDAAKDEIDDSEVLPSPEALKSEGKRIWISCP